MAMGTLLMAGLSGRRDTHPSPNGLDMATDPINWAFLVDYVDEGLEVVAWHMRPIYSYQSDELWKALHADEYPKPHRNYYRRGFMLWPANGWAVVGDPNWEKFFPHGG